MCNVLYNNFNIFIFFKTFQYNNIKENKFIIELKSFFIKYDKDNTTDCIGYSYRPAQSRCALWVDNDGSAGGPGGFTYYARIIFII